MSKTKYEWMFSKCFKITMSVMFFLSFAAVYVNNFCDNLSDFTAGFFHGFQLTSQVLWIIYAIICAYNKQSPFVTKEERNK